MRPTLWMLYNLILRRVNQTLAWELNAKVGRFWPVEAFRAQYYEKLDPKAFTGLHVRIDTKDPAETIWVTDIEPWEKTGPEDKDTLVGNVFQIRIADNFKSGFEMGDRISFSHLEIQDCLPGAIAFPGTPTWLELAPVIRKIIEDYGVAHHTHNHPGEYVAISEADQLRAYTHMSDRERKRVRLQYPQLSYPEASAPKPDMMKEIMQIMGELQRMGKAISLDTVFERIGGSSHGGNNQGK
jgi:hypothetical protein